MKSKVLKGAVLSTAILASANSVANAYNFNDKIYGKAVGKIGVSAQTYTGDLKDITDQDTTGDTTKNKANVALSLSAGYNLYYKASSFLNPFVGLEAQGRVPVYGSKLLDYEGLHIGGYIDENGVSYDFKDFFRFNAKFGTKMNISQKFALQPYALLGMNVMQFKTSADGVSDKKTKVGLTTGAGIEAIINDLLIIGAEYRFGYGKFNEIKVQTHDIGISFGVQLF